ncbi:MAG: hypothetical protein A2Z25_20905 [Planctomycetes bacterium RBG_16_55_9]|nr:MAG: hypothetical protein A2Z25_20905 [Planctomycetes bacterium RBG_16_55_9]
MNLPRAANGLNASDTPNIEEIYSRDLPLVLMSIDNATRAAESGDKTTAVVELLKVRKILISANALLGEHLKPHFANSHCPIMGLPIDVSVVDESLTRDYKGWKVAFCCARCPAAWDRLTDAQKQFRIPRVKF